MSEIGVPITLSITEKLTQSELDNINIQWKLGKNIQSAEMKESGWKFQRITSMKISFYKSGELNGSSYKNVPLRSSAFLSIKNDDKCCFIWSILAKLHPIFDPKNGHSTRVSKYRQCFKELNIEGFDFTNGFKCSDVQKFEKLNSFSNNIIERKFYQDRIK